MNVNLIGVPIFFGCDRKGVDLGPDKLRERNIKDIFRENNHTVYDSGNVYVPHISEEDKFKFHEKMKYLDAIIDVNTDLAHKVYSSLTAKSFPLVLGGDHSLGLGSLSGASKYFDNISVIWVDAHGDINTPETSPTGNVHGMPLAAAMGIGPDLLTDIYFNGIKIKPENVFIVGARDLDKGELKLIEEKKLNVYTTKDVRNMGIDSIMNSIYNKLSNNKIDAVHLSFDIDCLDSDLVKGTGTPVEDGMTLDEAKYLLKYLFDTRLVKSMDFVELNTELDNSEDTLDLCVDLLKYIAKYI